MSAEPRTMRDALAALHPQNALDVACGCGRFTSTLTPFCRSIAAVDSAPLAGRWQEHHTAPPIRFCRMDARKLAFADGAFQVVMERASLHHVAEWETVLDEMFRVSSEYVLLEEPLDDLRSRAKRRTLAARELFLELQRAVEYPHYPHLTAEQLLLATQQRGTILHHHIERSDAALEFDDYFTSYRDFAQRSRRPAYWLDRLKSFRQGLGQLVLCEDDTIVILTRKTQT